MKRKLELLGVVCAIALLIAFCAPSVQKEEKVEVIPSPSVSPGLPEVSLDQGPVNLTNTAFEAKATMGPDKTLKCPNIHIVFRQKKCRICCDIEVGADWEEMDYSVSGREVNLQGDCGDIGQWLGIDSPSKSPQKMRRNKLGPFILAIQNGKRCLKFGNSLFLNEIKLTDKEIDEFFQHSLGSIWV